MQIVSRTVLPKTAGRCLLLAVVLFSSCLLACSDASQTQSRSPKAIAKLPRAMEKAPDAMAKEVATQDFSQKIKSAPGDGWLANYLRDLGNYDISVKEDAEYFYVIFMPKDPPGDMIAGGDAEYKIRKSTNEIVSIRRGA